MALVTPRQGSLGQLVKIKETAIDVDPVTPVPVIVPLSDAESVRISQPLNPARVGDGRRTPKGSWLGMIDDSGDVPTSLDFRYVGHDLICHLGSDVYSRVGGVHRWSGFGTPLSCQLEKRHTQTPAIYHRHRGMFSNVLSFRPEAAGQVAYTLSYLGVGDEARTTAGGTDVDYAPFSAFNYFNGYLNLQGIGLFDIIAYSMTLDNKITRKDAYFHGGQAAALNFGIPVVEGDLGRLFSVDAGDTFYDLAKNETIVPIEVMYSDIPLSAGPTQWLRFIKPACRFSVQEPGIKIEDSEDQTQHFVAQEPVADRAAEAIGTVANTTTITIPASAHFFVKVDGGSTIDVPITAGARTMTQIAAEIDAATGFVTTADADNWNGHLRLTSKSTVAATSKIQVQGGTGNINSLVGFDTTIWSGQAKKPLYVELVNGLASDY